MPEVSARFAEVRWLDEVDSTNRVAADLAIDGLAVAADHQTHGRGRLGRLWEAPPGSSLLVSVRLPRGSTPQLATVAMALAASDACQEIAGLRPLLKWPNDVVLDDAKLGGVLAQTVAHTNAVVVGLGFNLNWGAATPPAPGVSLDALLGGRPVDRDAFLAALLRHLEQRLAMSVDVLLDAYRSRSATLGRRVRVDLGAHTVEGEAVAITEDGHLVVNSDDGGRYTVAAGDVVHLRPIR